MARTGTGAKRGGKLRAFLETRRERVDRALDRLLPPRNEVPTKLHQAMRYSVFAGGKRVRPLLCLLASKALGGSEKEALPAACALEMVHTYSLVHDDLPAMDDDDLRRGKPTCHKKFGEALAILAGDGLLTQAFYVLSRVQPEERAGEAVLILSRAAGSLGMVGGQVLDLEAEGKRATARRVSEIHRRKTGALIEASAALGAWMAGADPADRALLARYGENVGLAFQIVDDILDLESPSSVLGKTPGKDSRAGKVTYPAVHGIEGARRAADAAVEAAMDAVRRFPESALLQDFARLIIDRRS